MLIIWFLTGQFKHQTLTKLKEEIDSNTITVGDFNTPFSIKDRTTRLKINKEIEALNNTTDQLDLTDTYRTLHPTIAEYIFFSNNGTFSRIDYILSHKTCLNNSKRLKSNKVSSDHNGINLEIDSRRKTEKSRNMWKLNNILLKNQWVKEVTREIRKNLETNENKNTQHTKLMKFSKSSAKKEIYSCKCLL